MIKLNNQTIVSIVAAACLFGLVVVLKNLLRVPGDTLSRDVLLHIIIYSTFGILYPGKSEEATKSRLDNPLYWSLLVVLVTVAIIIMYAL
jgi:hypothetical protein